jgi:hypothetical protein
MQMRRWRFTTVQQNQMSTYSLADAKIYWCHFIYSNPRTVRICDGLLSQSLRCFYQLVGVPHRNQLENSDSRIYPCTSNGTDRNPSIDLIISLLLLLISAILLNYGIWNLYDGPCDWRSAACLVGGWFPFVTGLSILLFRVFQN